MAITYGWDRYYVDYVPGSWAYFETVQNTPRNLQSSLLWDGTKWYEGGGTMNAVGSAGAVGYTSRYAPGYQVLKNVMKESFSYLDDVTTVDVFKLDNPNERVSTRGSKIDTVTSTTSNAYPTNGVSGSYWYVSIGQVNIAPSTPTNIVLASGELKGGQSVNFTASGSTDPEGQAISYEYQYSYNNSTWTNFTTTFTLENDIAKTTVYIRARAKDSGNLYSAYYTKSFTVVQNTAPSITGTNSSLGTVSIAPAITYQVSDVDVGDIVTVVEKVDSTVLRSFTATQNTDYIATFTPMQWLKVPQGTHSLYIEATDTKGVKTVRTHTFTREETQIDFELKTPFTADTEVRRVLLTLDGNLPVGVHVTIEVCNNAFDAAPTWEDATSLVLQGLPYPFENTTKTAATWGVSFKINIDRGTAVGEVFLDSIGGAFD